MTVIGEYINFVLGEYINIIYIYVCISKEYITLGDHTNREYMNPRKYDIGECINLEENIVYN